MATSNSVSRSALSINDLHAAEGTDFLIFGTGHRKTRAAHAAGLKRLAKGFGCQWMQTEVGEGQHFSAFVVHRDVAAQVEGFAGEVILEAANHGLLQAGAYEPGA